MQELHFRHATRADLERIVALLADDALGAKRENYKLPLPDAYVQAFQCIHGDPHNELVVAESDGEVVGVLQLILIPSLTFQGRWRAEIEGVRVAKKMRSRGVGRSLFEWAIRRAREHDCHVVQLTTNNQRPDAIRFYEELGFQATHTGMKLYLTEPAGNGSDL